MYAAKNKNHAVEIADLLLQSGADPNTIGSEGLTALIWAAFNDNIALVQRLLDADADVNVCGICTALHAAVQSSTIEMVKLLLQNNADINMPDAADSTPLDRALQEMNDEMANFLLSNGAKTAEEIDWDEYDSEYYGEDEEEWDEYDGECDCEEYENPVYDAVMEGNINFLTDYMNTLTPEEEEETEFSYSDMKRETVLRYAAELQKLDVFEFFAKDMNVHQPLDARYNTLLHKAAEYGSLEIVKYLLSRDADINVENILGYTPVIVALENEHTEIVEYLKNKGANLNIKIKEEKELRRTNPSRKPIIFTYYDNCRRYDNCRLLEQYIEIGADINARGGYHGESILFEATRGYGSTDKKLASYLIKKGADVNAKNKQGRTPLFDAVQLYDIDFAKLLIENSADINATDENLMTPLFVAADYGSEHIEYLLEKGAKINHKDIDGNTPLHLAVRSSRIDAVKALVENGADVHAKNNKGHTPVYYTSFKADKKIIEYLEAKGADVESAGYGGTYFFNIDFSM
jgi:ankyrin repeat protein